jgi:predicted acyltransferase
MNAIRSAMSIFLVILFVLSVAGWKWSGGLPVEKMWGARFVLAMCCASAVGGLGLLWTAKQHQ